MFDTTLTLDCAGRSLRLDAPQVMGIVNVTPDSFSDGGQHATCEAAIAHGLALVEQGAAVLDVGGESTRPGAAAVSVEEELQRVIPVIEALAQRT
ncbi:dihydropteroate synthase, partial [Xanthomonas perforans]